MKESRCNHVCRGFSICVVALLAACSGGAPPIARPGGMQPTAGIAVPAATFQVLYHFHGHRRGDGARPEATLIDLDGKLYGTTPRGGAKHGGTVFSVTTTGTEKVLYNFGAASGDGMFPVSRLIKLNGALYGTTVGGGANGVGTVFRVTTAGRERVLYSFAGGSDGANPEAGLLNVNGTMYGTTSRGGTNGSGTVFSVATTGTEQVLHSFGSGSDGAEPLASLIHVNGVLYGTTFMGGANGSGTVFAITTTGTEKVLHSFGGADGIEPDSRLLNVNGTMYSTTSSGGSSAWGTVFSITTTGTEKVLYNFRDDYDAASPGGGLINVKRTLYGTTYQGGSSGCFFGCGTIFSITTAGKEHVLYRFSGGSDGAGPLGGLIDVNGTMYGTASLDGTGCVHKGCGTVFALIP